jgi:PAS domain S-box-containing protein
MLQYTVYLVPLLLATTLSAGLSIYAWRQQPTPGALSLAALAFLVAEWSFCYALEIFHTDLGSKVFWGKLEYIGIVTVPVAWLAFALQYGQRGHLITRRSLPPLLIVPLISLLLMLTTEQHGLMWSSTFIDDSGSFRVLGVTHGAWFWVHFAYSYVLMLLGTGLIFLAFMRRAHLYRWQAAVLVVAALIPWMANAIYFFGLNPVPQLEITPFGFTISCLLLTWGIFGFRLLDLTPIAHAAVLAGMRDGVIVLDARRRITDMNPAAEAMIGRSFRQLLGQPVSSVFGDQLELGTDDQTTDRQITLGQAAARRELDVRLSPLLDRQARLSGYLLVIRDITQATIQAEQLRQQAKYIASQHHRLHMIISASRDGIILVDSDQRILVINESALRLLRLPDQPNGWVDRPITAAIEQLLLTEPGLFEVAMAEMAQIRAGDRELREGEYSFGPAIISWQSMPVQVDTTNAGRLILLREVTEARKIERMRNDLTHTMVHDLRNPLTAIQASLDMLSIIQGAQADGADIVQIASRSSRRLLGLVNAILDLSRLESGQIPLQRSALTLRSLTAEISELLTPLAAAKSQRIDLRVPLELPKVLADAELMGRVLENLIGNAIKFTPVGGTISVSAQPYADLPEYMQISVSDTGPGIPEDIHDRLFEKFVTGVNRQHGSGLGLAFCRLAVEAHGGRIWLERASGSGATFSFTVPAVA